ncbi:hypothetical protein [Azospirillum argentinense]|uniref:PIN domain nuclease n=1 Tax=Azospirillum argentinense TaxID=2970906 RepID=UPI0032DEBD12
MSGYIIIDGNSIGFAAQASTRLSVGGQETQAIFGTLRTVRAIRQSRPDLTPIVCWDGVSWRKDVYPQYKAHRDKEATSKHAVAMQAARAAFKTQRPHIAQALKHLGVAQFSALNMEADDLAAILVARYRPLGKKLLLVSGDKDWLQLIGPRTVWFDPIRDHRVSPAGFQEFTGLANVRQLVELKALVGEAGDLGPGSGVGGIGDKTAREILSRFGSVNSLCNLWIEGRIDAVTGVVAGVDPAAFKCSAKVRDFLDETKPGRAIFARNLRLIDLNTRERPAPYGPKLVKGRFDRAAFTDICDRFAFKSILKEFDAWVEPFDPALKEIAA